MKSFRYLVLSSLSVLLTSLSISCNKQFDGHDVFEKDDNAESTFTIPLSDALEQLDAFLSEVGRIPTKGEYSDLYSKDQISVLTSSAVNYYTKSSVDESVDTLFYLVNFYDDKGFAVLSANSAIKTPVLAVTERGAISVSDFLDYSKCYDYSLDDDIDESPKQSCFVSAYIMKLAINSSLFVDDSDDVFDTKAETSTSIRTNEQLGPLLQTKWRQSAPFNNLLGGIPSGCCAIATAQIAVRNKVSKTMNFAGKECSWSILENVRHYSNPEAVISAEESSQVSHFIKYIRSKDLCNMSGTSGSSLDSQRAFKALGYKNVKRYWGMGNNARKATYNCLKAGRPIYVDGLKSGLSGSGHCWVVDGYLNQSITTLTYLPHETRTTTIHREYHHINWGWGGTYDGYYLIDNYDVSNRNSVDFMIDSQTGSYTDSSVAGENYTWDIWVVTYSL